MKKSPKFSPKVRYCAVRMVAEACGEYPSQWATIESIAPKIGCTAQTLSNWVHQYERDIGQRAFRAGGARAPIQVLRAFVDALVRPIAE